MSRPSSYSKFIDPRKNPKNAGMPSVADLEATCLEARRRQAEERKQRRHDFKTTRHPHWSPYYEAPNKERPVSVARPNVVDGGLVPMKYRQAPKKHMEPLDGGSARFEADERAQQDKKGIPQWSPYFRGDSARPSSPSPSETQRDDEFARTQKSPSLQYQFLTTSRSAYDFTKRAATRSAGYVS
ncbi:hypothetical protein M885DRAFT_620681 [Pelagophyceae sp. CCMP2097]|nr:hypothetical protein M885DRAFT_620681 [Pelagophyceae sp. CCMP2097]